MPSWDIMCGGGVSVLGNVHDTVQCPLIRSALGRCLDLGDLQRSCPTKIIL